MAHRRKRKDQERERQAREEVLRKRRQLQVWIGLGAVLAVVAVASAVLLVPLVTEAIDQGPTVGPRPGQVAPQFTIRDVDGTVFDLQAQRGKVVLLDFMGSRCVTCILEMPHLVTAYNQFSGPNFAMISIDVGGNLGTEDPSVARNFLATHGGTWPIALDNQGLAVTYDSGSSLPTLVVVDSTGIVRKHHPGVITSDELVPFIEGLL